MIRRSVICIICLTLLVHPVFAQAVKDDHGAQITTETLLQTTTSWNGALLPEYPAGQPEVTIQKIVIPPGMELPVHMHPVILAGVLTKGTLTVVTEHNETHHLKSGDPLAEVVNTWHHGRNEGTEPAEILVFYAGIQGKPITVKEEPVLKPKN